MPLNKLITTTKPTRKKGRKISKRKNTRLNKQSTKTRRTKSSSKRKTSAGQYHIAGPGTGRRLISTLPQAGVGTEYKHKAKVEQWWQNKGFLMYYRGFRRGAVDSQILQKMPHPSELDHTFHLKGYEFGGHLTQEDRYNYLAAMAVCLDDLNRYVLKFKDNNIGLDGYLGIAFGARGSGFRGAPAHFEPETGIIALSRYRSRQYYSRKGIKPEHIPHKVHRFLFTGGLHATAHEYWHCLDYFFGSRVEHDSRFFSLSGGMTTYNKEVIQYHRNYNIRNLVEQILKAIATSPTNSNRPSVYITKLSKVKSRQARAYLMARTELLARTFEQYIAYKLSQVKVSNTMLTQLNYDSSFYLSPAEFKPVVPLFDKLMGYMRAELR
jgi:hypothetical protein